MWIPSQPWQRCYSLDHCETQDGTVEYRHELSSYPLAVSPLTLSVRFVLRGTSWRKPALEKRPVHVRYLKIGYPCCLRFIYVESYAVDLFSSIKSRLGGLQGESEGETPRGGSLTAGRDLGGSSPPG